MPLGVRRAYPISWPRHTASRNSRNEGRTGARATADCRSAGGRADLAADRAERAVGVLAEGGDGGEAHHDDQGQHDRVFDRRRAVFTLDEIDNRFRQVTHETLSPKGSGKKKPLYSRRAGPLQSPI